MVNWAIRYRPIVAALERMAPRRVLEVGSGPEGLGMFWSGALTGVDLDFERRPLFRAVRGSGLALPFAGRAFPVVVASDTLEHIPPQNRPRFLEELARVCDQALLVQFPSGAAAMEAYQSLALRYGAKVPDWLEDHLRYGLPEAAEVRQQLESMGFSTRLSWNENAMKHTRWMWWETKLVVRLPTYSLMRLMGKSLVRHMPAGMENANLRVLVQAERPGRLNQELQT